MEFLHSETMRSSVQNRGFHSYLDLHHSIASLPFMMFINLIILLEFHIGPSFKSLPIIFFFPGYAIVETQ